MQATLSDRLRAPSILIPENFARQAEACQSHALAWPLSGADTRRRVF